MAAPELTPDAIRLDAIARLALKTAAGAEVHDSRVLSKPELAPMPALHVYTLDVQKDRIAGGVPTYRTTVELAVEGFAKAPTDPALAAVLGQLAEQVEDTLLRDPKWVGAFEEVPRVHRTTALDASGGVRLGSVLVKFDLVYTTMFEPEIEDQLDAVGLEVDLAEPGAGPDGEPEAVLELPIEQEQEE